MIVPARWTRRIVRVLLFAILVAVLLVVILHKTARPPYIPANIEQFTWRFDRKLGIIELDTERLCNAARLPRHPLRFTRRVYDLFLFSTELDWLEIRLNELSRHVDYFVIVESRTTFTGLPKPLYLQGNWDRFARFHRQIIYRVVDDPGLALGTTTWAHEDFMRNALYTHTFPTLLGTEQEARFGDVLVISDIDELPKPATLAVLRACKTPERLTLRSHFYYYSFQWLHRGEQWPHPQATVFKGLKNTITPNHLRNGIGGPGWFLWRPLQKWWQKAEAYDAAWHCSSCYATIQEMRTKMASFSHTPWNTEANRDPRNITERVRNGRDLFGRELEGYDRIDGNEDVPHYVWQHKDKWRYFLDRDDEHAAFTDWQDWETGVVE